MLKQLQQTILEMIARGDPAHETASHVCRQAETFAGGTLCSIVTVDRAGLLHPLAGPSLPADYAAALDGIAIGPDVGSCGAAAFRREPVAVTDIFTDHRWAPYKNLALPIGVRACWSSPILHSDGRIIGAFGFYYVDSRGPNAEEMRIVAECVDLCSILLQRAEISAENRRLAHFDGLTELGNRANFNQTLEMASGRTTVGMLSIDVDHLHGVNDVFGHVVGDGLIREVGRRIADTASPGQTFRVGGDEFAVLVEGEGPCVDVPGTAARILASMKEPFHFDRHVLASTVTCGGATSTASDPCDPATLRRQAELALFHAKQTARGGFVLYGDELPAAVTQRFQVLRTVTDALAEGRVEAHYQPVVRLDSGETVGLEALCRVRTHAGDILSAGQLTEAMQDLSVGSLVTDRMLRLVAHDIRHWLDHGILPQYVSVNGSMADFQRGDLRERILAAFSRHSVPLSHAVLEVTESVYMGSSDHKVEHAVEALRADGLRVALDDFGTGYASLTHLLDFPVDIVKIDKTFVDRLSAGDAGEVIIKGILDIAKGLGMRVVAEGVEKPEQAAHLKRLGCIFAQGYLFGRPADRATTTAALLRGGPA